MTDYRKPDFNDRAGRAADAKKALLERFKNRTLSARDFPWRIKVFHAHQPLPTDCARVEIRRQRRDQ